MTAAHDTTDEAIDEATEPAQSEPRQWRHTVVRPIARKSFTTPRIVVRLGDQTVVTNTLTDIDVNQLEPVRVLKSRIGQRNQVRRNNMVEEDKWLDVESGAEAMVAHLASRDPAITSILSQIAWVERLPAHDGTDSGWSCVDQIWIYSDGRIRAVEVKDATWEPTPTKLDSYQRLAESFRRLDIPYEIRNNLHGVEERLNYNLFHMSRHPHWANFNGSRELIADLLHAATPHTTWNTLRTLTKGRKRLVHHLIWHKQLCLDWSYTIDLDTVIRVHTPACETETHNSAWTFLCQPDFTDQLPAWSRP